MGQIAASQLLLRSGASVNLSGPQERTPLMLASSQPGATIPPNFFGHWLRKLDRFKNENNLFSKYKLTV